MAVTAPAVTAAIIAAGPLLKGPVWFRLATAIGVGVTAWSVVPVNVVMAGTTTGTVGSGVVNGKFLLPPVPLPVTSAFFTMGLIGPFAPQVAAAVGLGIGTAYSATGQYVGQSVGAVGPDVSKVTVVNQPALIASLNGAMAAQRFFGPVSKRVSVDLGAGIASMFLTGFGAGLSAGPTGPAPGTGVSKSSVY